MSAVQFDDQNMIQSQDYFKPKGGGLTGFVIKNGLAKDDKGANFVLMGIAGFFFALAIGIIFYATGGTTSSSKAKPLPPGTSLFPLKNSGK